jgi:hypothetical protein
VQTNLIPLFDDFVRNRYDRNTLYSVPPDREVAKDAILIKLGEISRLFGEFGLGKSHPPELIARQYSELAEVCKDGGLPLDRPDSVGERLGTLIKEELDWMMTTKNADIGNPGR